MHKAWNSKGEMPYCFQRSSIKFQGHTVQNITNFYPNWAFPDYRPVAAFKSLRFALFIPIPNEVGEYTGFILPVCLSVGPSVDGMVSRAWYQYTSESEFHISYAYSLCHCLDVHWVVPLKVLCFIIFTSKYWSSYWFKFLYQNMVWPKNVVVAK